MSLNLIPFPKSYEIASNLKAAGYTDSDLNRLKPEGCKKFWLKATVEGNRLMLSDQFAREYGIEHGWVGLITEPTSRYEIINPVSTVSASDPKKGFFKTFKKSENENDGRPECCRILSPKSFH